MSLAMTRYGTGDASYRAAGESHGIDRLVRRFYEYMDALPEARVIRAMHAPDLTLVREKLAVFLCAWLGGPNEYRARFRTHLDPGISFTISHRRGGPGCLASVHGLRGRRAALG